ncbi:MAG: FeoA domain-containing protein [Candidatus Margulisbacteria bacterium]|jgi:ferrous iron transport protein A|nr:FeoA domain-containing protein [Candidatus Margulisiibacteriota bacterium]
MEKISKQQNERTLAVLKVFYKELLGLTAKKAAEQAEILAAGISPEILERFCALIGHGHTHNIPTGPCCVQAKQFNAATVLPLNRLPLGINAKVIYIRTGQDQVLARLYELGVYPGQTLRIQQLYPTYILLVDGARLAIDGRLAKLIYVEKI